MDVRQRARQRRHRPGRDPDRRARRRGGGRWLLREKLDGWAFLATGLAIVLITATMFLNLYPRVMPSSISAANDLTIWNASSTHYTLTVMTWIA